MSNARVTIRDYTGSGAVSTFPATGKAYDIFNNSLAQSLQQYADDRAKFQTNTINIEDYGASPSASASVNDTAIANAIAAFPANGAATILVPNRGYKISASISPGAKHGLRIIGYHEAYDFSEDLANPKAIFIWDGPANGVMLKLAPRGTGFGVMGQYFAGLSFDGGATNGQANIIGITMGDVDGPIWDGSAWQRAKMENISIIRVFKGMRIGRVDVAEFKRIFIHNNNPITAGSIGIESTPTWTGGQIDNHFSHGAVEGFAILVQMGNTGSGNPIGVWFDHYLMENYSSYAMDIRRGEHITVTNSYFEGGAVPIQPIFKIGDDALALAPEHVTISSSRLIAGAQYNIRLERFRGLTIGPGNNFNGNNTSTSYVFWNNSGAGTRGGGQFFGNFLTGELNGIFDPAHGTTGFTEIQANRPDFGTNLPIREYSDHRRLAASLGPTLVSGDFALSAGFGTTATVSGIGGAGTATDARGRFTVNSAGTGQAANPTITITFKDLAWTSTPFAIVSRNGGNQATVLPTWSASTTTLTITFPGTPVAGESYTFEYILIG